MRGDVRAEIKRTFPETFKIGLACAIVANLAARHPFLFKPDEAGTSGANSLFSGIDPKDMKMDILDETQETEAETARRYRDKFREKVASEDGEIFLAVVRAEIIRHDGRFNI